MWTFAGENRGRELGGEFLADMFFLAFFILMFSRSNSPSEPRDYTLRQNGGQLRAVRSVITRFLGRLHQAAEY